MHDGKEQRKFHIGLEPEHSLVLRHISAHTTPSNEIRVSIVIERPDKDKK